MVREGTIIRKWTTGSETYGIVAGRHIGQERVIILKSSNPSRVGQQRGGFIGSGNIGEENPYKFTPEAKQKIAISNERTYVRKQVAERVALIEQQRRTVARATTRKAPEIIRKEIYGPPKPILGPEKPSKIKSTYHKAESTVSKYTTGLMFRDITSKDTVQKGVTQIAENKARIEKMSEGTKKKAVTLAGVTIPSVILGYGKDVRDNPIKHTTIIAASAGISAAGTVGKALIGPKVSALATKSTLVTKIAPVIAGTTKVGLIGGLGYLTGKRVLAQPKGQARAMEVGKVGAEITSIGIGTTIGQEIGQKTVGRIRTKGMTEVPSTQTTEKKVLTREKTFPTGPQKKHYKEFVTSKYRLPSESQTGRTDQVWKAVPQEWAKKTTILPGQYEVKSGTYVAPSVSPHFLRTGTAKAKYSLYSGQFFPGGNTPTIVRLKSQGIQMVPSQYRTFPKATEYVAQGKEGVVYVLGIKTEKEGVIKAGTEVLRVGTGYYQNVWGVRVPIQQYTTTGIAGTSSVATAGSYASSSSGLGLTTSIYTPASTFLAYGLSYSSKGATSSLGPASYRISPSSVVPPSSVLPPYTFSSYASNPPSTPYSPISSPSSIPYSPVSSPPSTLYSPPSGPSYFPRTPSSTTPISPPRINFNWETAEEKKKKKKRKKRKPKYGYSVSFTETFPQLASPRISKPSRKKFSGFEIRPKLRRSKL